MPAPSLSPSVFASYYTKRTSRGSFVSAIKKYLSCCLGHPVCDIDAGMDEYLSSREIQAVISDLTRFHQLPGISSLAPVTRSLYLGMVETYFRDCCDFTLPPLNQKLRRRSTPEVVAPITKDYSLSREMIRDIISVAPVRLRCEILVCCSSGLRISELLSLRFDDVFLDEVPARLVVRAENAKNGKERHSFLSAEATAALRLYYSILPTEWATHQVNGSRSKKDFVVDKTRIFPYLPWVESKILTRVATAAGYGETDPVSGRHRLHFHSFRKWFITQGKRAARPDFVESWAGHSGYLAESYFRPTIEEERAEYMKADLDLSVMVPDDYVSLKIEHASQLEKLQAAMVGYQEALSLLQNQINDMRDSRPVSPMSAPSWVLPPRE